MALLLLRTRDRGQRLRQARQHLPPGNVGRAFQHDRVGIAVNNVVDAAVEFNPRCQPLPGTCSVCTCWRSASLQLLRNRAYRAKAVRVEVIAVCSGVAAWGEGALRLPVPASALA